MKNVLFASAAVAALAFAAPALAQSQTQPTGYVGASYSNNQLDVEGFDADGDSYAIDGAVAFDLSGGFGLQFDAGYNVVEFDGGDDIDSFSGTAHIFSRGDAYGFGGFLGMIDVDGGEFVGGGVEGLAYLNNDVTLAGGLGVGRVSSDGIDDVDVVGVNGEARYFINDNFRLNGGLGYTSADIDGFDVDVWSLGLGGEYQFAAAPVSIYGNYAHNELSDAGFDASTDVFTIGVRYSFGGGSLRQRDRSGPAFTGLGAFGGAISSFNAIAAVAAEELE